MYDNLLQKLSLSDDIFEKVDILNELCELERSNDIQNSLNRANEAIKLSSTIDYKEGLAKAYWQQGVCYRLLSDFKASFVSLENSLRIYYELNNSKGTARVLNSIANIYADLNDHTKSLELLNKSLDIIKKEENDSFICVILSNIGFQYQLAGNYENALEYYKEVAARHSELNIPIPDTLYNNIGNVYSMLGDHKTALTYYFKSLELSDKLEHSSEKGYTCLNISEAYLELDNIDEAVKYFNMSLKILDSEGHISGINKSFYTDDQQQFLLFDLNFKLLKLKESHNDTIGMCVSNLSIGDLYFNNADYNNAVNYYRECLDISLKIRNEVLHNISLIKLAYAELNRNNIDEALEKLYNANENAVRRNAASELSQIYAAYSELYKKTRHFEKALKYLEDHLKIEKELNVISSDSTLMELIEKQQEEIKEKEIEINRLKNVELAQMNERLNKLNSEKNEFIGIFSHDLKNPLTGILSISKKLNKTPELYSTDKISEMAGDVVKASEKMFDLIAKMLDVTKIESGNRMFNFEDLDPRHVMERVMFDNRIKADTKHINVVFENELPDSIQITSDKTALRQILDNLLSNAIKFSPHNKNIYLKLTKRNSNILFVIKDEGPGLSETDKDKLFKKFTKLSALPTGDESSTGLGLYIVKKLTDSLNGKIYGENYEGGSVFILELPEKSSDIS